MYNRKQYKSDNSFTHVIIDFFIECDFHIALGAYGLIESGVVAEAANGTVESGTILVSAVFGPRGENKGEQSRKTVNVRH